MDLSRHFILLNGEPKTLQIDSIQRNGTNGFSVRFKNNGIVYNYSRDKVLWLTAPEWKEPTLCKVLVDGILKNGVREIWRFGNEAHPCWRIIYNNGYVQDDAMGHVAVKESCLRESVSKDVFAYMKNVATVNPLGKDENNPEGTLSSIYDRVNFIDESLAAACYLNPVKNPPQKLKESDLIFPFGCNSSQKSAVSRAFENQISVIQGPPGTGKTQTILNIIANIVLRGKTVMVVSNNNSATANVREKLEKYGLGFIVASLGSRDNKDLFIANQPELPSCIDRWRMSRQDSISTMRKVNLTLTRLEQVYALQNRLAELRQEQQSVELEWEHFYKEQEVAKEESSYQEIKSSYAISLWLKLQSAAEDMSGKEVKRRTVAQMIKSLWFKWMCKHKWHLKHSFDVSDLRPLVTELQAIYYVNRLRELSSEIASKEQQLKLLDNGGHARGNDFGTDKPEDLSKTLVDSSLALLKSFLSNKYKDGRTVFKDVADMRSNWFAFLYQYPVVLSTTFSARTCLSGDFPYDYIIIDEASQVSSDTGTLALTCAKNAVIVGDTKQLPNVETEEDLIKLRAIAKPYNIAEGYDCSKYCFLESVLKVIPQVPETMLREHYRCHPRIINFCNQKFYGGNLLIMTEDKGEQNVLSAIKTVKGNHSVNHFNQREIDVVKEEVLPTLDDSGSIGIVTPYNNQVDAFNRQICNRKVDSAGKCQTDNVVGGAQRDIKADAENKCHADDVEAGDWRDIKAGTIHKYQGREEDTIIMSVVDNQISEFADDARMLNVAVSRAKKKFCLVMTGNEQEKHGNIMDLLDYISYNNCSVSESKLASIFDYLYEQYAEQRMAFLKSHPQISEYASENLTYSLIRKVLSSDRDFNCLRVLCHIPLRQVINDISLMSPEEQKYASNYNTHLDFLIINQVSKKPVMAIETDGYSYHNDTTDQHRRDLLKNSILQTYGLPLLRLSTKGSSEREKIYQELTRVTQKSF